VPKGSDQIGPLKGVDEDVKYDSAAASALSAACRSAATTIDGQAAGRSSWVQSALEEFQGYYSTLFTNNASVAAADAINLSESLRSVATEVDKLTAAAQAEQKRRETARAWKKQHDGKNWWEKTWDSIFGEDPPPVGPAAVPVTSSVAAPAQGTRTPLTGSGSTGTSSADPGDLDLFATNSQTANDSLRSLPGSLTTKYNTFTAGCHWGGVEASGVFSAFGTYLSHNDNDVSWARAVASAFSRAGSEGGAATLPNAAITAALQSAGVTSSRDPIAVDPPTAQGGKVTSGYSDDPVNAATGNFVEPEVDLGFDGGCASLVWTRMYNSVAFERGAFGPGWASIADSRLIIDGESARWVQADGRHVVFPRQGEGWDRADGESLWLTADPGSADGGFVVRDNDGGCWTFCGSGRPATESRGAGTELSYRWAGDRLVAVVHERGRRLDLSWDGDRIAAVEAPDGRRVVYGYDDKGRLSTESVDGRVVRRYGWDDAGRIATVTDADGVRLVDNVYDEAGRVVWQTSPHGRRSHYTYLPGRATVVADADGGRSNTWIHDGRGRLVGIVDDEGRRQSASWDGYGNQVLVTERDGATTVRAFDERGLLVTEQVPSGARIQTGYDDLDRVVRVDVTSEPGTVATTRYEYAGADRNPSVIRDPEGGVTRVVWRHGLPVEVTDPTGVVVAMDYDERGDLVAVQDAAGSTARLERDATGRVVAAVTPLGHRTVYGYDEAGLCDRRVDPDGAVWRFEYTAAGRLSATVDPLGGRVETSYDDAGEEAATVDEIGRTIRRRTDDLGNLASVELPDGSRWEFGHDAASQLTGFTDGGGGRWEMSWDPAGRLSATRDATGVERRIERDPATGLPTTLVDGADRVGARYDRLGRVVAETGPDGAERTCRYDLCGRLVEAMDAQGQVTRIAYDAAGRCWGSPSPRAGGGGTSTTGAAAGAPRSAPADVATSSSTTPTGGSPQRCGRPASGWRPASTCAVASSSDASRAGGRCGSAMTGVVGSSWSATRGTDCGDSDTTRLGS
jgi:YD repeat-containing protein